MMVKTGLIVILSAGLVFMPLEAKHVSLTFRVVLAIYARGLNQSSSHWS